MASVIVSIDNECQTIDLAQRLARAIKPPLVLHLSGQLGAGKTTFSRGIIQSFGHKGVVKSPTYTLVEPYELERLSIYHFDLYRLSDPEELEFMGIRDYLTANSLCIVEWPEKGAGILPQADVLIDMQFIDNKRKITLTPQTTSGELLLKSLH